MPLSTGGGGGGYLPGADPRGYNPASGGVPGTTNPVGTLLGNLGGLGGLIGGITGAQSGALRAQYPSEYFSTLGTLLGNVQRRAAGDISDLLPELQTHAAERALVGGVSGSGAANTKLLRDLGLTRYGVESQALKDLSSIQGEIPQVHPYDPSSAINALISAQERADLYRAAPVPEAAYQRAMSNVGGGGGGGTPGLSYRPPMGGGYQGSVDDILSRYGHTTGYGPPIIAHGTRSGDLPERQFGADYDLSMKQLEEGDQGTSGRTDTGGIPLAGGPDWMSGMGNDFGIFSGLGGVGGAGGAANPEDLFLTGPDYGDKPYYGDEESLYLT